MRAQPTWTSLVLEYLTKSDDFRNCTMIREATGANQGQVSAACHHLRRRRAIDVIIDKDGVGWWYPTPETDNRTYTVVERMPEVDHRHRGKGSPRGARARSIKSGKPRKES